MRFNILLLVLLALFALAGVLMVSNMNAQTREMRALDERLGNIELIIHNKLIEPASLIPNSRSGRTDAPGRSGNSVL